VSRILERGPGTIRIRVGVAVVQDGRILLVPHYDTDAGSTQWCFPGGQLEPGESLEGAAKREFEQETGLRIEGCHLLDVSEVILPDRPYHSITITLSGTVEGESYEPSRITAMGKRFPAGFLGKNSRRWPITPRALLKRRWIRSRVDSLL
jgi:ADP-ribose pyrophosphatase YjhB (NUDIX family)